MMDKDDVPSSTRGSDGQSRVRRRPPCSGEGRGGAGWDGAAGHRPRVAECRYGVPDRGLTLTVPVGWTVVMHFRNHDGMLPHSAEVIQDTHPLPTQPVTPAFPRAVTVRLGEGLPSEGRDDIRIIADTGRSYLICCGVPGHGAAGMWIRLAVSESLRTPSLAATPAGRP